MELTIPLAFALLLRRLFRPSTPRIRGGAGEPSGPGSAARRLLGDNAEPQGERFGQAILLVLALAVMVSALLLSLSRGGLVSLVLASTLVLLLLGLGRKLGRWEIMVLAVVVAVGITLFLWIGPGPALENFRRAESVQNEPSFMHRVLVWEASLGIVRDFPAMGTGLGTFPRAFLHYYPPGTQRAWSQAHNDYIELITGVGLVGALVAGIAFLVLIVKLLGPLVGRRSIREKFIYYGLVAGILSLLCHSLIDFNLQVPSNAVLFIVLCAMALAQRRTLSGDRPPGGPAVDVAGRAEAAAPDEAAGEIV
jgi:O-antigen ligase